MKNVLFIVLFTINVNILMAQDFNHVFDSIEMVYVEGGSFTMGCTSEQGSDCYDGEKPSHTVNLSSFYIGKYEVTQAQWRAVMGTNPSSNSGCDNCPVDNVSWDDVQQFIQKLNQQTGKRYRLPTEAEWEYAARGGNKSKGFIYSGSDDIGAVAWYDGNSGSKTHPVGQKSPNELGIYDMTGNVWEWCSDWYAEYYYSSSPNSNPQGPSSGSDRVLRGGSWIYAATYCRVAIRFLSSPEYRTYIYGFRVLLSQ
jgi:sulfatase modifying factor 1